MSTAADDLPQEIADDRYRRLRELDGGRFPLQAVRQATAFIGGVGALGNEAAKNLALLGVGTIVLCDYDTVEIHNLTRSILARTEDVGRLKVAAAAETLRQINPGVRIVTLPCNVADVGLGVLRRCDLVFSDFDGLLPRLIMNDACMALGKLWIDAGLAAHTHLAGQVWVYRGGDDGTKCVACGVDDRTFRATMETARGLAGCGDSWDDANRQGVVPTISTTASIIAALQVHLALKTLTTPAAELAGLGIRFELGTETVKFLRSKSFIDCPGHARRPLLEIPLGELVERPDWRTDRMTLVEALEALRTACGSDNVSIRLPEFIVGRGRCGSCAARWDLFLSRPTYQQRRGNGDLRCSGCGHPTFEPDPEGGHLAELDDSLPDELLSRTLHELGVRALDILRVDYGEDFERSAFFEWSGDAAWLLSGQPAR